MTNGEIPPPIDLSSRRSRQEAEERQQTEEERRRAELNSLRLDIQSGLISCRDGLNDLLGVKLQQKVDRTVSEGIVLQNLNNNHSGIPPEVFPEDTCAFLEQEQVFVFNSSLRAREERSRFINHHFPVPPSKLDELALMWQISDLYGAIVAGSIPMRSTWSHGGTHNMLGFVAANGGDVDTSHTAQEETTREMTSLFAREQLPVRLQAGVSKHLLTFALQDEPYRFDVDELWIEIALRARKQRDLTALAYASPMTEQEVIDVMSHA